MKIEAPYLLGYDWGTTSCKATLIDLEGHMVATVSEEYPTYNPKPGWSEQEPNDWWTSTKTVTKNIIKRAGITPDDVIGIAFDGTAPGVVLLDKRGMCLRREIMYSDTRAWRELNTYESALAKKGIDKNEIFRITGMPWDATFGVAKYLWIKKHQPELWDKTYKILSTKDYGVYRSTEEISTDHTDAALSMLYNVRKLAFSEKLLEAIDIPMEKFPHTHFSVETVGELTSNASKELNLKKGIPVAAGAVDAVSSMVGSNVLEPSYALIGLGGAAFIGLSYTEPLFDPAMSIECLPHVCKGLWMLSAPTLTSGASLKWFKKEFYTPLRTESEDIYRLMDEEAATSKPGSSGLIFLPYLLGERCPLWDPKARGAFIGISLTCTRADFIRAIMEGVAYSLRHIAECLEVLNVKIKVARISGGGSRSPLWRQIICDVLGISGSVPEHPSELSAIGSALCAGVAANIYQNIVNAAEKTIKTIITHKPNEELHKKYTRIYELYKKSYPALKSIMHSITDLF